MTEKQIFAIARKGYIVGRDAARKLHPEYGYDAPWSKLSQPSKAGYIAFTKFVLSQARKKKP